MNINEYLVNFNFDQGYGLPILATAIVCGVVGCVITGVLLAEIKTEKIYKKMLIFVNVINLVNFGLCTLALFSGNIIFVFITFGCFGFINSPLISISTEMAVNTCFPIGEGLVAGVQ